MPILPARNTLFSRHQQFKIFSECTLSNLSRTPPFKTLNAMNPAKITAFRSARSHEPEKEPMSGENIS
jgi:hypothetical protein